jgi:hypothetical protein
VRGLITVSGLSLRLDTPIHVLGVAIRRKDMADNRLFSVRYLLSNWEISHTSIVTAFYSNRDWADPRRKGIPISKH